MRAVRVGLVAGEGLMCLVRGGGWVLWSRRQAALLLGTAEEDAPAPLPWGSKGQPQRRSLPAVPCPLLK